MIRYKVGDATQPCGDGIKLIVHCCNTLGAWGAGFTAALSKRWPQPETYYRAMAKRDLGAVEIVHVEHETFVANLIGQEGLAGQATLPPIRYEALGKGFESIASWAMKRKASVHMPRIGCGLAGGDWDCVEPLLDEYFVARSISVTVYDWRP